MFCIPYPGFRRYRASTPGLRYAAHIRGLKFRLADARMKKAGSVEPAKVNCEFEKSAQMSHLCRFHPFGVQQRWGGCLPPLSPPTTERASRSLLWIPLCGTAFD